MQATHTPLPWTLVGNEIRKVWGLGHVVVATFGEAGNAEDEANARLAFDALARREPLMPAKLDEIARQAQIDFCLNKATSFETAFAHGIEAAHDIKRGA